MLAELSLPVAARFVSSQHRSLISEPLYRKTSDTAAETKASATFAKLYQGFDRCYEHRPPYSDS
jgi:hypothetical protein